MADAELALDDTSDFTIGSFIQTVYDQVPATITREQALGTLMALQETYDNPDIAKRLALLAEDCEIEDPRSEEHTSELPSLMRISYAVFCLQKKNTNINNSPDKH